MKKRIWMSVLLCSTLLGGYFYLDNQVKVLDAQADMPMLKDLASLEERADLIIIGEPTDDEEVYLDREETGEIREYATKRTIKVKKVFSNGTQQEIDKGDEIIMWEPTVLLEDDPIGKTRLSIEGYRPMKAGKKYMLFLKPNYTHPQDWIPVGVTQGKYSTIENDDSNEFEKVYPHYQKVKKEVLKKYKE